MWPVNSSPSVPHTPTRCTSMTACPEPATGASTSSTTGCSGTVRTNARIISFRRSWGCHDFLTLKTQVVDAECHHVTGLEVDRRLLAHADARWRPGVDQVAGLENHELAEVVDQEERVEQHRAGAAVLSLAAVDRQPQVQRGDRRQLVRRCEPGPARVERLRRLAFHPLAAALDLELALADVVDADVAGKRVPGGVQVGQVAGPR